MFQLFGDYSIPKNGLATKRGRFSDPVTVVCEAEQYDYSFVVYGREIIAQWCIGNWYLGGDTENCLTDRMTVAQSLLSLRCNCYENSL